MSERVVEHNRSTKCSPALSTAVQPTAVHSSPAHCSPQQSSPLQSTAVQPTAAPVQPIESLCSPVQPSAVLCCAVLSAVAVPMQRQRSASAAPTSCQCSACSANVTAMQVSAVAGQCSGRSVQWHVSRCSAGQMSAVLCIVQSANQCSEKRSVLQALNTPPTPILTPPAPPLTGRCVHGQRRARTSRPPAACACSGTGPPCCLRMQLGSRCSGAWGWCVHARRARRMARDRWVPSPLHPWQPLKPTAKDWQAASLPCSF
jgi:hypothetical protein